MGGVFFRRRNVPRAEVINDRNGEVVNLFRIPQRHYPQFMDTLKFQVTSRREFERPEGLRDPATLTDLERAARFIYLQKLAFGGKVAGQNFGVVIRWWCTVQPDAAGAASGRRPRAPCRCCHREPGLAGVIINRYDRPGTLSLPRSAAFRE